MSGARLGFRRQSRPSRRLLKLNLSRRLIWCGADAGSGRNVVDQFTQSKAGLLFRRLHFAGLGVRIGIELMLEERRLGKARLINRELERFSLTDNIRDRYESARGFSQPPGARRFPDSSSPGSTTIWVTSLPCLRRRSAEGRRTAAHHCRNGMPIWRSSSIASNLFLVLMPLLPLGLATALLSLRFLHQVVLFVAA